MCVCFYTRFLLKDRLRALAFISCVLICFMGVFKTDRHITAGNCLLYWKKITWIHHTSYINSFSFWLSPFTNKNIQYSIYTVLYLGRYINGHPSIFGDIYFLFIIIVLHLFCICPIVKHLWSINQGNIFSCPTRFLRLVVSENYKNTHKLSHVLCGDPRRHDFL